MTLLSATEADTDRDGWGRVGRVGAKGGQRFVVVMVVDSGRGVGVWGEGAGGRRRGWVAVVVAVGMDVERRGGLGNHRWAVCQSSSGVR